MSPDRGGVMGAELVAPTVTMTTSGPALCDCGRLGVVAVDCAHPRGRACAGSVPGAERGVGPHAGCPTAPSQRHHHRCDGARHHRPCHSEADLLALMAITFGCSDWALGTSRGSGLSFTSLSSRAFHSDHHSCGQGERCDQDQTTGCYPQSGQRARYRPKRAVQRSSGQHGDQDE